jgi:hypothetical protein
VRIIARSIVLIAALLPSAGATTITILPAENLAQAFTERNSWLTASFGAGTTANPIDPRIDNVTPGDSNGVVKLQLLTSLQSLYFFITGVEKNMQIRTADGASTQVHDGDDTLYFVGITSSRAIESIQWQNHGNFVLEDFGVPQEPASSPEPTSWLCLATGLFVITVRPLLMRALWKLRSRCGEVIEWARRSSAGWISPANHRKARLCLKQAS